MLDKIKAFFAPVLKPEAVVIAWVAAHPRTMFYASAGAFIVALVL